MKSNFNKHADGVRMQSPTLITRGIAAISAANETTGAAEREDLVTWFEWLGNDDCVSFVGL